MTVYTAIKPRIDVQTEYLHIFTVHSRLQLFPHIANECLQLKYYAMSPHHVTLKSHGKSVVTQLAPHSMVTDTLFRQYVEGRHNIYHWALNPLTWKNLGSSSPTVGKV